jgi:hypothetical protein
VLRVAVRLALVRQYHFALVLREHYPLVIRPEVLGLHGVDLLIVHKGCAYRIALSVAPVAAQECRI